jgi:hypothetical protein
MKQILVVMAFLLVTIMLTSLWVGANDIYTAKMDSRSGSATTGQAR